MTAVSQERDESTDSLVAPPASSATSASLTGDETTAQEAGTGADRPVPASPVSGQLDTGQGGPDEILELAPADLPESFPVSLTQDLHRRRSVFSADYARLGSARVMSVPEALSLVRRRSRRPSVINGSLQLLDDLTNRPVDPLFEDARLVKRQQSGKPALTLLTRIVTFLVCAVIGLGTLSAIQELNKDPRQKVRVELAGQLTQAQESSRRLTSQVHDLQTKVGQLSERLAAHQAVGPSQRHDSLTNGTEVVSGPGLQVVLNNPVQAPTGVYNPFVNDGDLRSVVNLLWAGQAEAISVNNVRLGPGTSIRVAGSSILVGVTGISPPYIISAIGQQQNLENAVQSAPAKLFFGMLEERGIQQSISTQPNLQLGAAQLPGLAYAGRSE